MILFLYLSVCQFLVSVQSFLHFGTSEIHLRQINRKIKDLNDSVDPGAPLFLTPYIESGRIDEGKRLARVPFTDNFNFTSYAGFFTVDKAYDSNLFMWYFPPIKPTKQAPVLVWLQGGPGGSSLIGLFLENGPLTVLNGSFQTRNINWALNNHMIYIDSPVGTGFSFTKDGYCKNQTIIGEHLYSGITQFLQLFPELQNNNFFITGESYAGKYVPAFAYTIHKKNPAAELKVNLKGIAIGDGWTDPANQLVYSEYLYQIGLIDEITARSLKTMEEHAINLTRKEQWIDAAGAVYAITKEFRVRSGFNKLYNYLDPNYDVEHQDYEDKIQENSVRNHIHVGPLQFNRSSWTVYEFLAEDNVQSVADWLSELLDHYLVLVYTGQLDIIVPYPSVVNYLRKLNFNGSDEYPRAQRHIWRVDGEVAGYMKVVGNLVEVLVRNSGHLVPKDQPKWALDLITKFTNSFINE